MSHAQAIKSTNVRSSGSPLRLLSAVAPGAMSAVAATLFTWPRSAPRPARERAHLETAMRIDVRSKGRDLAAWQWGSGDRTTLLVHGWQGRGSQLGAFVAPLVRAGHRVVAFDAPAHGDSPGITTTIADFRDAIHDASAQLGGVDAVIAHSMGGAALSLALAEGLSPRAVVLVSPPATPLPVLDALGDQLGLGTAARARLVERIEQRVGMTIDRVDLRHVAPELRVPALVVHDRRDRFVPWESGEAIARAWPGAHLESTDGLGHGRILSDPDTVRRGTRFVLDHTPAPARRELDRWLDGIEAQRLARNPSGGTFGFEHLD